KSHHGIHGTHGKKTEKEKERVRQGKKRDSSGKAVSPAFSKFDPAFPLLPFSSHSLFFFRLFPCVPWWLFFSVSASLWSSCFLHEPSLRAVDNRWRGPARPPDPGAWSRRDADLHAGRHAGDRQGTDAAATRRSRRTDPPRQHLSPHAPSRRRPHCGTRR